MKKNKPPFFIIGNPRSGTTLLRLMLTSNKQVVIPPESSFFIWFYKKYSNWKFDNLNLSKLNFFLEDLFKAQKFENWKLNKDDLRKSLIQEKPKNYSELIYAIYHFYSIKIKKKYMIWGDKNNYYLNKIDVVDKIFPNSKFIHIIRDGRNVACSYIQLSKKKIDSQYAPKLPAKLEEIANEWNKNILTINRSFKKINKNNFLEVKFEELILQPKNTLKTICNFLGASYDANMLNYYNLTEDQGLEPKEFLAWKKKNQRPLLIGEIDRYKKELSLQEIDLFNSIAKKSLEQYHYIEN